jgi:NAD(P)-dependent dehydrogenase (short-subunit alcohol dehydrogenase family)
VFAKTQPIPKPGDPSDIAAMALFLASDESRWVSGATMVVDGGQNTAEAVPLKFDE